MIKYLVFSDIHGNLPATETMLKRVGKVDGYICLGDIVNYGPWGNECVDLILSLKDCICICGNHEKHFIEGKYPGRNLIAKSFFDFCYPKFDRLRKIKKFISGYSDKNFIFTHTILDKYIYPDTTEQISANHVIGHSHHQFTKYINGFRLHNTGSVGQNRKYINIINYTLYYPETGILRPQQLSYDPNQVINEMRRRIYPKVCIDYYQNKERLIEE